MKVYALERSNDLFPRFFLTIRESKKRMRAIKNERIVKKIIPLRDDTIQFKLEFHNGLIEIMRFDYRSDFSMYRCLERYYENIDELEDKIDPEDFAYLKFHQCWNHPLDRTLRIFYFYTAHSHLKILSYRYNNNEEWNSLELELPEQDKNQKEEEKCKEEIT